MYFAYVAFCFFFGSFIVTGERLAELDGTLEQLINAMKLVNYHGEMKKPAKDPNDLPPGAQKVSTYGGLLNVLNNLNKVAVIDDKTEQNGSSKMFDGNDLVACGPNQLATILEISGKILSPGFSKNTYYDNQNCSWKIIAPPGKHVVMSNEMELDIEQSDNCSCDSLHFFDVVGKNMVPIGKYCGENKPLKPLISSDRVMVVRFTSDCSNSIGKFSFQWSFANSNTSEPICGNPVIKPNISQRIVNGMPAVPYSWPWQVSLILRTRFNVYHFCGGTLVKNDVVITAAHCAAYMISGYYEVFIVAGCYNLNNFTNGAIQISKIKYLYIHREYKPIDIRNDIAIIILETPVKYTASVRPACLTTENPDLDSLCYVTGWGDTHGTGDKHILNQARVGIISQLVCSQSDFYGPEIIESKLCAGYEEGGPDSCQGDSGGPLVCQNKRNRRWYLQGVVSYGEGCGRRHKPGVYTRVTYYRRWINDVSKA